MRVVNNTNIPTQTILDELKSRGFEAVLTDAGEIDVPSACLDTDQSADLAEKLVDTFYEMTDCPEFNDIDPTIDYNAVVLDSLHDRYANVFAAQMERGDALYKTIYDLAASWSGETLESTHTLESLGLDASMFSGGAATDSYMTDLLYQALHAVDAYVQDAWKGWGSYASAEVDPQAGTVTFSIWENC